jgi:hypothetical protein
MEDFNNAIGFGIGKQVRDFQVNNSNLFKGSKPENVSGILVERDKGVEILEDQINPPSIPISSEGNSKKNTFIGAKIGSSLGFIVALGYAFKVKSGFLKGWGYTILGSMALGGLGAGVGFAIDSSKNKK